jgi:hypothetical protein
MASSDAYRAGRIDLLRSSIKARSYRKAKCPGLGPRANVPFMSSGAMIAVLTIFVLRVMRSGGSSVVSRVLFRG